MEEASADLAFVERWRERSAEFSSGSDDELATVITRALEVMVSSLRPNFSYATVQRLLTSLQNERNLSMRYDRRNNGIRTISYGLVESLHRTILHLVTANQRLTNSNQLQQASQSPQVIHDEVVYNERLFIPAQLALAPLPVIKIEERDFEDDIEENETIATRNDLANVRSEPAHNAPMFAQMEEEEEIDVKPVIEKRKRGRPKKYIEAETMAREQKAKSSSRRVVKPMMKKVKVEVEDNEMQSRQTRRVKRETSNGDYLEIPAKMARVVPVKKELLDGLVEGNDCLVCGQRLMRRLRGYIDHHTTKHGFTMQEHRYYLVCECGEVIERSSAARIHDKQCDKMSYTVHRREPLTGGDQ